MNLTHRTDGYSEGVIHDHFGGSAVAILRLDQTDRIVWDEIWRENVYGMDPSHVSGRTVIDIGANVGAFSIWAGLHNAAKVIAVEPEPGNLAVLRTAIAANPAHTSRVEVIGAAVVHDSTKVKKVRMDSTGGGAHSVKAAKGDVTVPTISFADLLAGHEDVLLKVDVEGAEYDFLKGDPLAQVARLVAEWHQGDIGALVTDLLYTHHVSILGRPTLGGNLFAVRYGD